MSKQYITENNFEGGVAGMGGTVNTSTGYGTFSSPQVSQNSANFVSNNNNKALGNTSNLSKNAAPNGSMEQDLNAIYSKKETPTPDDIIAGIQYEMGNMIKKSMAMAKQIVVKNLKQNPRHYRDLNMLNINDKTMMDTVNEHRHPNDKPADREKITPNVDETKKIFAEMAQKKDKKFVVNSKLVDVMDQMWENRRKYGFWG